MKKLTVILGLVLVTCLLVPVSCAPPSELPAVVGPVNSVYIPIDEFQSHPHIDVVMHTSVGEELKVTLGSNPTTGFRWSELAEISDETVVQQTSHKYVGKEYKPPPDKPPPGTSGNEVWTFKALQRGTTTIYLEYSRPWVEEEIGYWTVTITANIK